ncbi:MAG: hypothetical protein A2X49_03990 [Lentisphaerae bacterium GWF2_52_8]|nr:MAG: hypothetical protein A2X49_03990 [Lentisphaerae bacterium GWF2_52_8]
MKNGNTSLKNGRREAFCRKVADGTIQSEAYKELYGIKQKNIAAAAAARLCKIREVADRLTYLKEEIAEKILWTRREAGLVLSTIARDESKEPPDRIKAIQELNKMCGYHAPKQLQSVDSTNLVVFASRDGTKPR